MHGNQNKSGVEGPYIYLKQLNLPGFAQILDGELLYLTDQSSRNSLRCLTCY